ncbi:hypothetical protein EDO6_04855 [Paenibacillus xylanexedens]|nr:hypothetical protein EDO6_04855 [Paenibacillus xylanexedens]
MTDPHPHHHLHEVHKQPVALLSVAAGYLMIGFAWQASAHTPTLLLVCIPQRILA